MAEARPQPLVELRGIVKAFPGALANAGIDLAVYPGEVLALLGENGAGKTTLMNILSGLYRPDEGEIRVAGARVVLRSPRDAIERGIGMVHQHFRLVERFSVAENVLLGSRTPRFRLSPGQVVEHVRALGARHGIPLDPRARVGDLSVGERQRVEILKVLYRGSRVLIFDEPTSVLAPPEVETLFAGIRHIVGEGRAVVFISHKLDEVLRIATRIVVLRHGRVAGAMPCAAATPPALATLMVGREIASRPREALARGPLRLRVEDIAARGERGHLAVDGASLAVHGGEIVGIAGVAGNGQAELAEAIAGVRAPLRGRVWLDDHEVTGQPARAIRRRGLAFIPEDRLRQGLVPAFTVVENAILSCYRGAPVARGGVLRRRPAREHARRLVDAFRIQASLDTPVRALSGGNQQRLLVAREAAQEPTALVALHPTAGLDVASTESVHRVLLDLRARGVAVLLISEHLDEVLALADRVLVMYRGRIVHERPAGQADVAELGLYMTGVGARP
jgi:simple sugar transport system ATP-binding protein